MRASLATELDACASAGPGCGMLGTGSPAVPPPSASVPTVPAKLVGRAEVTLKQAKSPVANASAVIAGMRAGFRRCYNRLLSMDPAAKGTLKLLFVVTPQGEVALATTTGPRVLEGARKCIEARVQSAQFAAPDDGKAHTLEAAIVLSIAP